MLKYSRFAILAVASLALLSAAALSANQVATPTSPVIVGKYEIRNADRGLSKRVKVYYDGARIATFALRRGETTSYCCTADSCKAVEVAEKCDALKMTCSDGACSPG
jgi:hypothetical protein